MASCTLLGMETLDSSFTSNVCELARRCDDMKLLIEYFNFAFMSGSYCFFGIPQLIVVGSLGYVLASGTCKVSSKKVSELLVNS